MEPARGRASALPTRRSTVPAPRSGWDGHPHAGAPAPARPPTTPLPRAARPTGAGRHAVIGPVDPRQDLGLSPRATPTVRRWANWLLLIPMVLPLLTPLYNRRDPYLWGVPFFYWYQIACAFVACLVITTVYLLTKGRR